MWCQIPSLHPGKGRCGFKPSSGDVGGLPPLLGHQGFSHKEKGPPGQAVRQSEVQARCAKAPSPAQLT